MAIYKVQGPDGAIHKFEGPDDATPEEVEAAAAQQFGGTSVDVGAAKLGELASKIPDTVGLNEAARPKASQIPGFDPSQYPGYKPAPATPPLPEGSPLVGAGETALSVTTGIPAGLVGNVAGLASRVAGSSPREAEARAAEVAGKIAYAPRTKTGQEYVGKVGELASTLPPTLGLGTSTLAGPAASQLKGYVGKVAAPVAEALVPTPVRAALGQLPAATVRAAMPAPSAEALKLARKASELGIPLRPDMLYDNKITKIMGEAIEQVPLSGAKKMARSEAFNNALIRQIGGDSAATRLTPDVYAAAMKKSGDAIGRITEKTSFPINSDFHRDLVKMSSSLEKAIPEHQGVVFSYAEDLMSKERNKVIPGGAVQEFNSNLSRDIRGTTDPNLKRHLQNFQDVVMDQLTRQMSKADRQAFIDARTKYAKGMTLEPLVAKATGTEGNISPALLQSEVAKGGGKRRLARGTAGEMGDLAAIGQRFIKEPASSGTAERALAYELMAGGGAHALGVPGVIPAMVGANVGANIVNRLGPSVSRAVIGGAPLKEVPRLAPRGGLSAGYPRVSRMAGALASIPRKVPPGPLTVLAGRLPTPFPALPRSPEAAKLMQAESED